MALSQCAFIEHGPSHPFDMRFNRPTLLHKPDFHGLPPTGQSMPMQMFQGPPPRFWQNGNGPRRNTPNPNNNNPYRYVNTRNRGNPRNRRWQAEGDKSKLNRENDQSEGNNSNMDTCDMAQFDADDAHYNNNNNNSDSDQRSSGYSSGLEQDLNDSIEMTA